MATTDKRRHIIQALEALCATRRYHEITLDDVARQARVGKGTIYRYFADKDDLFHQTSLASFDELCRLLERHSPSVAPFEERLKIACREISRYFDRRGQVVRLAQSDEALLRASHGQLREDWMERRRRLVALLTAILDAGAREGRVRTDVDPAALALMLLGMLRARAHDQGEFLSEQTVEEIILDLFMHGAAAPSAPVKGRLE